MDMLCQASNLPTVSICCKGGGLDSDRNLCPRGWMPYGHLNIVGFIFSPFFFTMIFCSSAIQPSMEAVQAGRHAFCRRLVNNLFAVNPLELPWSSRQCCWTSQLMTIIPRRQMVENIVKKWEEDIGIGMARKQPGS
jgi:hypothetical protein